jgi:hypothetical protein
MADHIEIIRAGVQAMRDATTTVTGLVLPPAVAAELIGWLDEVALVEEDYYRTHGPDSVGPPEPYDAAHGAWTIARAYLSGGTEEVPGG